MKTPRLRRPWWALANALLLGFSTAAVAEPPSRAARLGVLGGTVSFAPAGQTDWVRATVNRPLTSGDSLWTEESSRAELQIGGAAIRLGPSTSMVLLNLDDRITQVQLSQGTLNLRVRSLGPRQTVEVATPNLAVTLRRPGDFRVEVDPDGEATVVTVRSGEAEVYGQGASYTVDSRRAYRFYGNDLSDYETLEAQRDDDLDRWSRERDRRADRSVSARYVSSEVVGHEDLDAHGSWRVDASHGAVWTPTRVASGWTPYRDGHWSWIDPWGWTWVDDAPWGYAVSHYGRWANIDNTWAWVPGPRRTRAVYAPALVAFIGGTNFQVSGSAGGASAANVGWFPLAPREIYRPAYPVSRTYFDNINRSNAVVAPTTINNVYNTTVVNTTTTTHVTNVTNVVYANRRVAGSVVVVPAQAFVQSQPVAKATVQLPREVALGAPVMHRVAVAPIAQSVQGGAREATTRPPTLVRPVVARTAPPPAPLPFAVQQAHLAAKPGAPIDEAQRVQLKAAAPALVAPKVSVAAAAPVPTAATPPPATPPAARSPQERRAAAALAAASGVEARRQDTDKPDGDTGRTPRADAARAEAAKREAAQAAAARTEAAQARAGAVKADQAEAARVEAAKVDSLKTDAPRASKPKVDGTGAERARRGADQGEASKAEGMKAEAARADAGSAAAPKAENAKADVARAPSARTGPAGSEAAKAEPAKPEVAAAQPAKPDAKRADAVRAAPLKGEHAKADATKVDAARAGQAKAEAAKASAAKAEADRAEVARVALVAKAPAATVSPPKAGASGPKSGAAVDDEKKEGRRP